MCGIWQLFYNKPFNNKQLFDNLQQRGPDNSNYINNLHNTILGFHRLAINDISNKGIQPFYYTYKNYNYTLLCNGEIYNYKHLLNLTKYIPTSTSDCEVLLPYFVICCYDNIETFLNGLNGEFSLIITITNTVTSTRKIYIATDPLSLRPLFYQYYDTGLLVSSLLKGLSKDYKSYRLLQSQFIEYLQRADGKILISASKIYYKYSDCQLLRFNETPELYHSIVKCLFSCVNKRLSVDRPLCCLLSGGLDSSLIAAITQKILKQYSKFNTLHTFSIGMKGSNDLEYAKIVATHIGSVHTEVFYTKEEALNLVDKVIYECETYDITTIRASIPQYILGKYISENTEFKVVLNGDGADEIAMGYLYFYNAPSEDIAQKESIFLIKNISKFDGLRVDRTLSSNGLEARFPFLDKEFVSLYLNIDASLKIPTDSRIEKYLLRSAFNYVYANDPLIPPNVLWRKKEAFSDGVSSVNDSWYTILNNHFKDMEIEDKQFNHVTPISKESMYYRLKFDEYFGKNAEKCIPYFWMPQWSDTKDPSARTLSIYINRL